MSIDQLPDATYIQKIDKPRQRYHEAASLRKWQGEKADGEIAARLFAPFQTHQEREMSARRASESAHDSIWLRTCYDPELATRYDQMAAHVVGVGGRLVDAGGVFDDASTYAFGEGDWSRILIRVPELCDTIRFSSLELHAEVQEEIEGAEDEMDSLTKRVAAKLYLMDRAALDTGFLKVLWLDSHGECLWDNTIAPRNVLDFAGALQSFGGLGEILETFTESKEKGARLLF